MQHDPTANGQPVFTDANPEDIIEPPPHTACKCATCTWPLEAAKADVECLRTEKETLAMSLQGARSEVTLTHCMLNQSSC